MTDALNRLAAYEDTGMEPEDIKKAFNEEVVLKLAAQALGTTPERLREMAKARNGGRAVVLPQVSERDRQGMADFLHDCFAEWIHDPSVGLFGMTEGEAALANAIMSALTRAEAEAALGGGGDG